jgi:8-oxo-dGTP diphosphatase
MRLLLAYNGYIGRTRLRPKSETPIRDQGHMRMTRRFGPPPESGRIYKTRPGAYAILPLGNQILITHQDRPFDEFQLPGGGIDPGESPIAALHREVFEETGWSVAAPRRMGVFRRFTFMPEYDLWAEKICTIYLARPARRLGPPSEANHTPLWLDLEQAKSVVYNEGDQHFLSMLG